MYRTQPLQGDPKEALWSLLKLSLAPAKQALLPQPLLTCCAHTPECCGGSLLNLFQYMNVLVSKLDTVFPTLGTECGAEKDNHVFPSAGCMGTELLLRWHHFKRVIFPRCRNLCLSLLNCARFLLASFPPICLGHLHSSPALKR